MKHVALKGTPLAQLEQASVSPALWATQELTPHLPDLLAHFLLSLRAAQTRISYAATLREFFEYAHIQSQTMQNISDITEPLVLLWLTDLKKKHSRTTTGRVRAVQATVARKLSTLSSLLEFARKRGLIDTNCVELVSRPKLKRESKTNAFTLEEVQTVLRTLERECKNAPPDDRMAQVSTHLRLAVLQTLFSIGMRVEELCSLRVRDFEDIPDASRLHLNTKGGEHHAPYLHDTTASILRNYLARFRSQASPDSPLFVRAQEVKHPTFLHRSSVHDMVKEAAILAGLEKRVSPHSCRATLATLLHNKGVPLGQIQDLLNHKQITTTALYVKKAQEVEHSAALKLNIALLAKTSSRQTASDSNSSSPKITEKELPENESSELRQK